MSEESFVPKMIEKGIRPFSCPLPLTHCISISKERSTLKGMSPSLGNSSLEWLDTLITEEVQKELEKFAPLITTLKTMYYKNPSAGGPQGIPA
jgi:hypothetical protein